MRANAVIFEDQLVVKYREVTVPDPGPNDVVVRTHLSWISNGTEGSFLRAERTDGETPYRPGDPWPFPFAPGYQSTGVVESVGEGVENIEPGQWVFCAVGRIGGMFNSSGGHVSPKVADKSQIWPIPEGVDPEAVSGLVLTQVGYNCGTRPPLCPGSTALVIGDGLVGHWAAQTLHWRGANVILAGKHDDRLAFFNRPDRALRLNVSEEDIVEGARRLAPDGIDILVDTVGSLPTVLACHPLMRRDGHIVSAGFNEKDSLLDIQRLRFGELTLHSPSGWTKERMDATLELIVQGHLETTPLITHHFPVQEAQAAWKLILERTEPVLGVILTWD